MRALAAFLCLLLSVGPARAFIDAPFFADAVASGQLPPVDQRLPRVPAVASLTPPDKTPGRYGGELRMLAGQPKDTRLLVIHGYARLVRYDENWTLVPDILERLEVSEGRVFTLRLRPGHRWSDGHPFTAEDFRFQWEDVINHQKLSSGGPERFLLVDGKPPRFEVLDETSVRYSWEKPNPFFLPALAGARPEYIFAPAHYLKPFHAKYADERELARRVKQAGQRGWTSLFAQLSNAYRNDNPDLPSLEPWVLTTKPPSSRYVFTRNPYYYRVDPEGRQLPYIDTVALSVVSPGLITAKTAVGESDLQARGISFDNYTVLKEGAKRNPFEVRLWRTARGAEMALYPDLTVLDPVWRGLARDVRFRRALSLAVDRKELNQVIFFGLAKEGNNTLLPESPLFKPEYASAWAGFDLAEANRLLDAIGLTARDGAGIRLLPNGRPLEIVVETAGEEAVQVDILQLIADSWRKIGVRLFTKPEQREVLRNRAFAGTAVMTVWFGLENGLATATTPPLELAPTSQQQLQWPKWGQYYETQGKAGEPVDLPEANELLALYQEWTSASEPTRQAELWRRMLAIWADQVFTIGTVRAVPQPVVVNAQLRNVPRQGVYNWDPGAFFGVYKPDTFWFADNPRPKEETTP